MTPPVSACRRTAIRFLSASKKKKNFFFFFSRKERRRRSQNNGVNISEGAFEGIKSKFISRFASSSSSSSSSFFHLIVSSRQRKKKDDPKKEGRGERIRRPEINWGKARDRWTDTRAAVAAVRRKTRAVLSLSLSLFFSHLSNFSPFFQPLRARFCFVGSAETPVFYFFFHFFVDIFFPLRSFSSNFFLCRVSLCGFLMRVDSDAKKKKKKSLMEYYAACAYLPCAGLFFLPFFLLSLSLSLSSRPDMYMYIKDLSRLMTSLVCVCVCVCVCVGRLVVSVLFRAAGSKSWCRNVHI